MSNIENNGLKLGNKYSDLESQQLYFQDLKKNEETGEIEPIDADTFGDGPGPKSMDQAINLVNPIVGDDASNYIFDTYGSGDEASGNGLKLGNKYSDLESQQLYFQDLKKMKKQEK